MELEREIEKLRARNTQVDKNKAWETSWFRKLAIALMTFATAFVFLKVSQVIINPKIIFASALIPALAYFLSTLSLPPLRALWEKWQK